SPYQWTERSRAARPGCFRGPSLDTGRAHRSVVKSRSRSPRLPVRVRGFAPSNQRLELPGRLLPVRKPRWKSGPLPPWPGSSAAPPFVPERTVIMPTLTWKDSRLAANDIAPWDTTVMFVGPKITIAELVRDSESWCKSHEGDKHLMIYCHGLPAYLQ